ncbi:coiled-coil domain-containing protein 85B-like [Notechis scutatus]|uniref:Coiled-coil domain-containing protein 85B-like n=1 Tax=Notechis scutatus TaxID=8663 RepID=A0A6J1UZ65_9SAUR|nr:coiled-coil domain-containing protein 85B-like [Notechis scutatus]
MAEKEGGPTAKAQLASPGVQRYKDATARLNKVDLDGCSKEEMVHCLHREEAEKLAALVQCGRLIQGVNQQLQEHLCKIRELKAIYGRLQAENRKLRNLCYFLDEDQLKAKCLASHWQIFGHHMAQVLRYEVASCLCKLAGLEGLLTPLKPTPRMQQHVGKVEQSCCHRKVPALERCNSQSGEPVVPMP